MYNGVRAGKGWVVACLLLALGAGGPWAMGGGGDSACREARTPMYGLDATLGYDEAFRRKWVYYLCYCEAGFEEGSIDVGIYQYRKPA